MDDSGDGVLSEDEMSLSSKSAWQVPSGTTRLSNPKLVFEIRLGLGARRSTSEGCRLNCVSGAAL